MTKRPSRLSEPCRRGGWLAALLLIGAPAGALEVELLDDRGQPLADAVVWVEPAIGESPAQSAVMDQVKRNFDPFILPVQAGAEVSFPNSDDINHHVYSFSASKRFELKLAAGDDQPHLLTFERPGLVTIGCNLHDWMLGFILVLDTPWFAQTNALGRATLDLPAGNDRMLHVWHPRIAEPDGQLSQPLQGEHVVLQLLKPLKPDPRVSVGAYR